MHRVASRSRVPTVRRVIGLAAAMIGASVAGSAAAADPWTESGPWLALDGEAGPGAGRRIVFVTGDEEYRSEEAMPQIARILAERHGFECRVLFAIDPDTRRIDPDRRDNIPGLAALEKADLMVIQTRFRTLPDEQMAHIDAYVKSGKPIVGIRTATHAFQLPASSAYHHYDWRHDSDRWRQGFGREILGETWITHHGAHSREGTRGRAATGMAGHPILRGIADGDIFGDTDVYGVRLPLPDGCEPVVLGEIVAGLEFDDPAVEDDRNDPMMPIAWTRTMPVEGREGAVRRVFTSTIGAATDFKAAGTRRLLVQGIYWALGMQDSIPPDGTDVDIVGTFEPSPYNFGGAKRDVRPSDLGPTGPAGTSPADDVPAGDPPASAMRLEDGDTVLLVGNSFGERIARSGALAALAHAAHPEANLVVRHAPWSGDEAGLRPRETNVPTVRDWIMRLDADIVIACFGMVESFRGEAGLGRFEADLDAFVEMVREARPGDPAEVVFVQPIEPEDLGAPFPTGDQIESRRAEVAAYVAAMRTVAARRGVRIVDAHADPRPAGAPPRTENGIHPTERGAVLAAGRIAEAFGWIPAGTTTAVESGGAGSLGLDEGAIESAADLRDLGVDTHHFFQQRYRPTNTEYVWGRRRDPYGSVSFPPEQAQLDRMLAARDAEIHAMTDRPDPRAVVAAAPANGAITRWSIAPIGSPLAADAWDPPAVVARGTETSLGSTDIAPPDEFVQSFTVADGYVVDCFASEEDFEELANPLALAFDDRGRLWVLCAPTYPHLLPGSTPDSRLLVLEDTDGDGRADTCTTFADRLMTPTGFAIDGDDVYVGEAPDLLRFRDLDGDGRADRRDVVATGFGMCDSHHQISAFTWTPGGGLLLHEGVFTVSAVETPWGIERTRDAATWHFDPRSSRLVVMSHSGFANPWGHTFDDHGQSVLADASGGANFAFSHVISAFDWPHKPRRPGQFLNRGRPTAGALLLSGRHVPPGDVGTVLINQSIGFHGTRWDRVLADPDVSGWKAERLAQDMLATEDVNFRPVAIAMGLDGAIYIADWCNPIIGHMQYSIRDPRRDASHGRVWRVRHASRPLVEAPEVAGIDVRAALDLLRIPERSTRDLVRRRLQTAERDMVLAAAEDWFAEQVARDAMQADPDLGRIRLEMLWLHQAHGSVSLPHVDAVLDGLDGPARAGAVRVIRHWLVAGLIEPSVAGPRLEAAINDQDMRVRLEAVVASGFMPAERGESIAVRAVDMPMDGAMFTVLEATLEHLGRGRTATGELVRRLRLRRAPVDDLMEESLDPTVASVRLARSDVPGAGRDEALAFLARERGVSEAAVLVSALEDALTETEVEAIGGLIVANRVADDADAASVLHAHFMSLKTDPARRIASLAALLLTPRADDYVIRAEPEHLVAAVIALPPGTAPESATSRVRSELAFGRVAAMSAVDAVVRHGVRGSGGIDGTAAWLDGLVERAGGSIDRWTVDHDASMAAARARTMLAGDATDVDAAVMALGHEIYHDEAIGCVRCHGADGAGAGGYPRLDRSPWIVGDPRRAAAIVVHGLHGPLTMPDGQRFSSAMAPLGDVLDDRQVAAVLTYTRRSWGNHASPVSVADVAAGRAAAPSTGGPWSVSGILARFPMRDEPLGGRSTVLASLESTPSAVGFAAAGEAESATDPVRRGGGISPVAVIIGLVGAWVLAGIVLTRRAA